jgi:hypothetical protein
MLAEIKESGRLLRSKTAERVRGSIVAQNVTSCPAAEPDSRQLMREACTLALSEAVPTIEKHMATYTEYLANIKYRAERLSDVVSFSIHYPSVFPI